MVKRTRGKVFSREKRRISNRRSYKKRMTTGKRQDYYLRKYYGITLADQRRMLEEQGNCCAICKTDKWGGNHGSPNVDHCHITGRVRGLLCQKCNFGLSAFNDNTEALAIAIRYLHPDSPVPGLYALPGLSAGLLF